VRMIESGPAAGTLMAAAYGELAGHRDLVAFDMGGTTAKLALIVAAPLGLSVAEAAWGIHLVVKTDMEVATRVVSIEGGRDPRALTLVAFGGSGPAHGCRLAQALGIPRVILPAAAGVTAALGLLAAELRFDVARTHVRRLDDADPGYLDGMYAEMEAQAAEIVRAAGGDMPAIRRSADCRYLGQGYELSVPVPPGPLGPAAIDQVPHAFDEAYAQRYGYASPGEARGGPETARKGRRPVYFPEQGGYVDTPVLRPRRALAGRGARRARGDRGARVHHGAAARLWRARGRVRRPARRGDRRAVTPRGGPRRRASS
jgi:N-methylhydantoinase A